MQSFFFYDLETTGFDRANDRIMQFAGVRTDLDLNIIGEKYNFLVKLSGDVLPSPEAIMVTKITPRQTLDDGYTEAEAVKLLTEKIFTPGTIAVGYNNVRFDDEFIRHLFWRNFVDAYEWAYRDGRSRWDLLDVVRMVRAIRPEGLNWPVDAEGKATNRLELLSKANGLEHEQAHDALSDVEALIGLARLIKQHQPKIWQYLLDMRDKNAVAKLVNLDEPKPFVYSSGRMDAQFNKTTVAVPIAPAKNGNVLIYDLRYNPLDLKGKTSEQIRQDLLAFREQHPTERAPLYVKELKYNRCPAVAPLGVMTESAWKNIGLDLETVQRHLTALKDNPEIVTNLRLMIENSQQAWAETDQDKVRLPEASLYDGFIGTNDKAKMLEIATLTKDQIRDYLPSFQDERLNGLWLGYKARSFERLLTEAEHQAWDEYRANILAPQLTDYLVRLQAIAEQDGGQFYAEELRLWMESLLPE